MLNNPKRPRGHAPAVLERAKRHMREGQGPNPEGKRAEEPAQKENSELSG